MKALICTDSFKGTLTSIKAAEIISDVLCKKGFTTETVPVADGGEGTVDALVKATGGEKIYGKTIDALGRELDSYFGKSGNTGFLEAALSCGITFLAESELSPKKATSRGLGIQILQAVKKGCDNLYIGIGGTATNELGIGMLAECGAKFYDRIGMAIKPEYEYGFTASDLKRIEQIEFLPDEQLSRVNITILSDVKNPLYGEQGASFVYGPQKGANEKMVRYLDDEIKRISGIVSEDYNIEPDFPGAGAAGGLGFSFKTFFNAEIISGIEGIIRLIGLEEKIEDCDFVIVGEGSMDEQSAFGKAPIGIAKLAKSYGKQVFAITGRADKTAANVFEKGIDAIFARFEKENSPDMSDLKPYAEKYLYQNTENFVKHFKANKNFKNKKFFFYEP